MRNERNEDDFNDRLNERDRKTKSESLSRLVENDDVRNAFGDFLKGAALVVGAAFGIILGLTIVFETIGFVISVFGVFGTVVFTAAVFGGIVFAVVGRDKRRKMGDKFSWKRVFKEAHSVEWDDD